MLGTMAEIMQAMVLTKLAPIETHPLRLMSVEKPTIMERNGLFLEIEAWGYAGQTCTLSKVIGNSMGCLQACQ